jgi:hypothetical protein
LERVRGVVVFVAFRRLAVAALSAALSAVYAGGVTARQLIMADIDPHDGVARAHAMPVQGLHVWDQVLLGVTVQTR